jgi:Na+/melibiose symporter-like transporter
MGQRCFLVLVGRMIVGMGGQVEASPAVYPAGEVLGGMDKGGLITIIVVSIIAIVAFVWIFRETGRRD